eukprot:280855_1
MDDLIVDFPSRQAFHSSSEQQQQSPSPPTSSSSRLQVSFSGDVDITFIQNLSYDHKSDLWFTNREMKSFKYQTALILRSISSFDMTVAQFAEMNAQDTSAFLGLENYLSDTTSEKIKHRRNAICKGVLLEQKRQREAGICDPEAISMLSEAVSELSRRRAHIIGLLHMEKRPAVADTSATTTAVVKRPSESFESPVSRLDKKKRSVARPSFR